MFSLFKKKPFFSREENEKIVESIRNGEKCTSGEIRVFVESKCRYVEPLDRAFQIFSNLEMEKTKDRNAVLVYVAIKDRQLAIYADSGIHQKVGEQFWQDVVKDVISHFDKENYAAGLSHAVWQVGDALQAHFPYDEAT